MIPSLFYHSMKWVESPAHGQGGPDWVEVNSTSATLKEV